MSCRKKQQIRQNTPAGHETCKIVYPYWADALAYESRASALFIKRKMIEVYSGIVYNKAVER